MSVYVCVKSQNYNYCARYYFQCRSVFQTAYNTTVKAVADPTQVYFFSCPLWLLKLAIMKTTFSDSYPSILPARNVVAVVIRLRST
jgi:hypothetical protein